jgi:hypothetical protein
MLEEIQLTVMQLAGRGYCCSQIMALTALNDMGRDNPDLIRTMAALCSGMGDGAGACGVYSGAVCALALHAGKGCDAEMQDERLPLLIDEMRDWFLERTSCFGGTSCAAVCGNEDGRAAPDRCGPLIGDAVIRVKELLAENGFDISQGREPY